jgi:basic amino acid/polyamine antiporter, APA family
MASFIGMAQGLRRALGLTHATAMVAGTIIGASIFVQPSEITRQMPSVTGIVFVWIAAGVLTLFGALLCAELASAFPETGGVYVFLRESCGAPVAFLWGWAMLWSMHSGIIAAIATVFARYAAVFVPMSDTASRLVAASAILLISAINYLGVQHGGRVQNIFTLAKVGAICAVVAVGALWQGIPPDYAEPAAPVTARGFVLAIAAGLFAYGGWHMVTYTAGETRDPTRTIPRALLLGTLIVTACYVGMNLTYLRVLPLSAVRGSSHVAADAADVLLGGGGARLMAAVVLVSTFGAVNGIILVGPRVYYSMARDGLLFAVLGTVDRRFGTPGPAILVQAVVASALALTNTYGALFSRVIYTEWIFFALMAAGLLALRRRPDYKPAYRLRGGSIIAVVFIAASLVIVGIQLTADVKSSLTGLGLVLAGLPVYVVWSRRAHRRLPQPLLSTRVP